MRHPHLAGMLALALLLVAGCTPPPQDTTQEARAGIEATIAQFTDALSAGDAAGVAACYTENAQLMPPNEEAISGQAAVQAFFQEAIDNGLKAQLEIVEVEGHGDTAHEVGRVTITGADGQTLDEAKYVVIWKRVGDAWKLHRDIWNSNLPLPAPEAAEEM